MATHKPIPYETGVARCEEEKHERSHSKYHGPKNPLYVGHDPKVFFIALNSKTDWTLQILPTEIVNKNMERFNLHFQPPRP